MRIGILGAVDDEIALLRKRARISSHRTYAGITFTLGTLAGQQVIMGVSGVGKANAALATQILIDHFRVHSLIFTGTAGSISRVVKIGDVVVSTRTQQYDVDFVPLGYPLGGIPFLKTSVFPASRHLRAAAKTGSRQIPHRKFRIFHGKIVSGDQFVASKKLAAFLRRTFRGVCVEAEGAAMGQVAFLNRIPYIVIRGISDTAGSGASENYEESARLAAHRAQTTVFYMLKNVQPGVYLSTRP